MEKSIENIWNTGFMNSEELEIPKVMNLYNQKSKLLLDKFKKTYQIDNKVLLPMAVVIGVGLSLFGYILLGIYIMVLLVVLFFTNKKLLQSLENIKVSTNSYDYLTTYRGAIKKIIKTTTKIIGLAFPLAIIPAYWLFFKNTEMYSDIVIKVESAYLLLLVIGLAIVLGVMCVTIYRVTTKLIYGTYLRQLDGLISDMDVLKAD